MGRRATLIVQDGAGALLGSFACRVALPYLQETEDLLAAAAQAGLQLTILRLLEHTPAEDGDTRCIYLAEARSAPPSGALAAVPPGVRPDDHRLRLAYARPGGVASDIAWAEARLRERGLRIEGQPIQMRTWNLSCVHRLPLADGDAAWLKVVPPFFAHEGGVIELIAALEDGLAPPPMPRTPGLLAHDAAHGRVLLAHCEGPLGWGIDVAAWASVVEGHVARQSRLAPAVPQLLAVGVADWRAAALVEASGRLLARADVHAGLTADVRARVDALLTGLPQRLAAIAACGLPDTLVHGDLHPGNVVLGAPAPTLLDWGDAGVGQPLLDLPALCHGFPADAAPAIRAQLVAAWQHHVPGADVARALRLMAPVNPLRQALVYQGFLDGIEPSERHYHADDVPRCLLEAVQADRSGD